MQTNNTRNVKIKSALILMLTLIPGLLLAQSINRTSWEMNRGGSWSYLNFSLPSHGYPGNLNGSEYDESSGAYANASIPAGDDTSWEPAPNGETIGFSESSILPGNCLSSVDYTYFQTFVNVPTNTSVTQFTIEFSTIDDGGRVTVFNANYPNGIVIPGSYVTLANGGTADLGTYITTGQNRVVVTQVDDCPTGNNLNSAIVVLNGSTVETCNVGEPQTFTIFGANGNVGDIDPYSQSLPAGATEWQPVYLTGSHPWGFIPGTDSWVNFDPNDEVGLNTRTPYRIRFVVPEDFSNPSMIFNLKADNRALIWINDTFIDSIDGQGSPSVDVTLAEQALHPGLNEIRLTMVDWGGIVGFNYRIDVTMTSCEDITDAVLTPDEAAELNQAPMADAGPDQNSETASVTLDGSGSSDPDENLLSYSWSENGNVIATGVNPTITLADGTHNITLTVSDGELSDTDEVIVNVDTNDAPVADAGADLLVSILGPTTEISLDGSNSSDPDGDVLSYSWTLNGSEVSTNAAFTSTLGFGVHSFTLMVNDGNGETASDDVVVSIVDPLVAYWKAEGNGEDETVNNNDVVSAGASAVNYCVGAEGQGFEFTGSNWMEIPDNPSLNIGSGDMAIVLWAKLSDANGIETLLDKRDPANGYKGYVVYTINNGFVGAQINTGNNYLNWISPINIADNQWHHIVFTIDRDNPTGGYITVDATQTYIFDPTGFVGDVSNAAPLRIGGRNDGLENWVGCIDDVRLYNYAFTPAEILADFEEITPPTNEAPVADAGADFNTLTSLGQTTQVVLDGSASSDPDNDVLSYAWSGTFGTATGVSPTISLGAGTHTITLTVDDGNGESASDEVVVSVTEVDFPLIDGLVGYWPANGDANDATGNANGALGASTAFECGVNGDAFSFDGAQTSLVTVPVDIGPSAYPEMTMGMFVKLRSQVNSLGWVMGHSDVGWDRSLVLHDYRFNYGFAAGAGGGAAYNSTLPKLKDDLYQWYFVAAAYDSPSGTAMVYINDLSGTSQVQAITATNGDGLSSFSLGGLTNFPGHTADALVDEVFIFDRALTQAELDQLCNDLNQNPAPVAVAGADQSFTCVLDAVDVTLDGSASSDLGCDVLTYSWSLAGTEVATSASFTPSLAAGTYDYVLTVNDGVQSTSDAVRVVIEADTENPTLVLLGDNPATINVNHPYIDGGYTATDACDPDVAVSISETVDHQTPGTYTLTYTATDDAGNQASAQRVVTVTNPAPIADAGSDQTGDCDPTFYLNGAGSTDDGELTYSWILNSNLLVNGSFEDGMTGWAHTGVSGAGGNSIDRGSWGNATDGSWIIDLVGTGDYATPGHVEQSIVTEVGRKYVLSFDIIINGAPSLVVTVDGSNPQTFSATGSHAMAFTATSTSTTIRLSSDGSYQYVGNNLFLDNVSLDGEASNSASFTTTALTTGSYTYTLTVTDAFGAADSDDVIVTATADTEAPSISLLGTGPFGVNLHGAWTDPGYETADNCNSEVSVAVTGTVDPETPGDYTLTYTATDEAGNETVAHRIVTVINAAPIAVAGDDQTIDCVVGTTDVTLAGSASSDADGDAMIYSWSFGGSEVSTAVAFDVNHSAGSYTYTLTVNDGFDSSSDDVVVTVVDDSEPPVITLLGDNPATGNLYTDYVDAGYEAVDACGSDVTMEMTSTVNINEPGSYTVTYTATDAGGNASSLDRTVEIINTDPVVANAIPDITLSFGDDDLSASVDFSTVFYDADINDVLSYTFTSTNPAAASAELAGSTLSLSALDLGQTIVTATATDPWGGTVSESFTVTVNVTADLAGAVLWAVHEIKLDKEIQVASGNILVNESQSSNHDNDDEDDDEDDHGGHGNHGDDDDEHGDDHTNYELKIEKDVVIAAGYLLKANAIQIKNDASIASDVYSNTLDNSGDISGEIFDAVSTPLFVNLPPFKAAPAGNQNITVNKHGDLTLEPGDYGRIYVRDYGTLTLTGGVYNIEKLETKKNSHVRFQEASEVRVEDELKIAKNGYVGPAGGSFIGASDIIFYVADDHHPAKLEERATFYGTIYAPNGEVDIKKDVSLTGAVLASRIDVDKDSEIVLDSYFSGSVSGMARGTAGVAWVEPEMEVEIPLVSELSGNYPNPFNPSTTIDFALNEAGDVSLKVYDIRGAEIASLVQGYHEPGYYSVHFTPDVLSSGTYIYVLDAGSFREVRRMLYLK